MGGYGNNKCATVTGDRQVQTEGEAEDRQPEGGRRSAEGGGERDGVGACMCSHNGRLKRDVGGRMVRLTGGFGPMCTVCPLLSAAVLSHTYNAPPTSGAACFLWCGGGGPVSYGLWSTRCYPTRYQPLPLIEWFCHSVCWGEGGGFGAQLLAAAPSFSLPDAGGNTFSPDDTHSAWVPHVTPPPLGRTEASPVV